MSSNRRTWLDDDVERLLGPVGEIGSTSVEHFDGCRQRSDRRSQLVTDVGGESLFALDPLLDGVGHLVERSGQPVEVGIVLCVETRPEGAGRDLAGRVGDPGQRSQESSTRRPTEERRNDRGQDRPDRQRGGQDAQGSFGRVERKRLEVADVPRPEVDTDAEPRFAVDVGEELLARGAEPDGVDERLGEIVDRIVPAATTGTAGVPGMTGS